MKIEVGKWYEYPPDGEEPESNFRLIGVNLKTQSLILEDEDEFSWEETLEQLEQSLK